MLTFGDTTIDSQRHELLEDGTAEFPVACYFDDLKQKSIPWHWHEDLPLISPAKRCLPCHLYIKTCPNRFTGTRTRSRTGGNLLCHRLDL